MKPLLKKYISNKIAIKGLIIIMLVSISSLINPPDSIISYKKKHSPTFYYQMQPSVSLSVAGIKNIGDAVDTLNNIAGFVKKEGPKLIVHLVNWYRFKPEDMTKTLYWNGDAGKGKDSVVLTSVPLFGYYSCSDSLYIEWLLGISVALGINELNIDYEGGIGYSEEFNEYYKMRPWDSWLLDLMERAEKYDIKISVMYEPKSIAGRIAMQHTKIGHQEKLKILKTDLKNICNKLTIKKNEHNKFVPSPVYKRIAGLPVIWVFNMTASGLSEEIWKQAIEELRTEGYAFVLVSNTYKKEQAGFDSIVQGMYPWLDQLFTGLQSNYPQLWNAALKASEEGNYSEARRIADFYIDEMIHKGVNNVAVVRKVEVPSNFNITPLVIGFQDAAINGWGFRPPLFIESSDRTYTEPGKLFRAFFAEAQKNKNQWFLICSGDDIPERTHTLIPDLEFGFSGPYSIALASAFIGNNPDINRAIQLTEEYILIKNNNIISENIQSIIDEAYNKLPGQLKSEIKMFKDNNQ